MDVLLMHDIDHETLQAVREHHAPDTTARRTRQARQKAAEAAQQRTNGRHKPPLFTRGEHLQARAVKWHWEGWLAKGTLTICAGAPEAGKGTLMAYISMCCITGQWPDGSTSEPGKIILHAKEEPKETITIPRLLAAGLTKEQIDSNVIWASDDSMTRLDEWIGELGADSGVRAIIFDDIADGLAPNQSENDSGHVAKYLLKLTNIAKETGISVIGNRHIKKYSKDFGGALAQLVLGSTKFIAIPRMVWLLIPHDDGAPVSPGQAQNAAIDDRRTLIRVKSNLPCNARQGAWVIVGEDKRQVGEDPVDGTPIEASVSDQWVYKDGNARRMADDALGFLSQKQDGRSRSRLANEGTILAMLKDGPLPSGVVCSRMASDHSVHRRTTMATMSVLEQAGKCQVRPATDDERKVWTLKGPRTAMWEVCQNDDKS